MNKWQHRQRSWWLDIGAFTLQVFFVSKSENDFRIKIHLNSPPRHNFESAESAKQEAIRHLETIISAATVAQQRRNN